ncbi:ADP-ribosyl cyclase/cyclic ADP-ribose hydrolase [Citrus sinensis]|nr:ADP-ribosyl cyclase/cyclic ADP-ribose hydrolase [Citrus sinensis]
MVKAISSKIPVKSETLKKLVRIDSCLEELRSLMDEGLNDDVRMIGICGMGGLGSRLQHKKVLLVIDDVVDIKQLEYLVGKREWFGSGSRIIITSRDEHLLKTHGVDELCEPNGLNYDEALQLLNTKAFKTHKPLEECAKLSERVPQYAGGLPLALKVLGSFLNGRSTDQWRSTLERLKRDPPNKIMSILQISFDGLQDSEKKIFLDVACFFKWKSREYVTKILEACGFSPVIGIEVLIEKSLLIVDEDNRLQMHDLLQELGHQIVQRQSSEEPGKRSRILKKEEVRQVLIENAGSEVIEGIIVNTRFHENEVYLSASAKAFLQMSNLRLLKISNVQLPEGLEYLSSKLRLLDWHRYPLKSLPSNLQLVKAFEFNMCYSCIEELWKGIKPLNMLKVMKLNHSKNLIKSKTPDFTEVPNLEELDLEAIEELPLSIELLSGLVQLTLKGCKNLSSLLISLSSLKCLRTLELSGCSKLKRFLEIVASMEDLSELYLDGTFITKLPLSIELLTGLELLNLNDCKNLLRLPSSIDGLCSLSKLDLSYCGLGEGAIPNDIGNLCSLKELYLSKNNFVTLPASISGLLNLKELELEDCALKLRKSDCTIIKCIDSLKLLVNNGLAISMLQEYLEAMSLSPPRQEFKIVVPGSEIPKWFMYQNEGSSITVTTPSYLYNKNKTLAFDSNLIKSSFETILIEGLEVKRCGFHPVYMHEVEEFDQTTKQ